MKQSDMERMFGATITVGSARRTQAQGFFHAKAHHLWCRKCFRVFPNGVYRLVGASRNCPYGDCDGQELSARGWGEITAQRPRYPGYPTLGVRYPDASWTAPAQG